MDIFWSISRSLFSGLNGTTDVVKRQFRNASRQHSDSWLWCYRSFNRLLPCPFFERKSIKFHAIARYLPRGVRRSHGGLGNFGFSDEVAPLGELSYKLHRELASAYQGRQNWGFSDQNIFRVIPKNFTGDLSLPNSWGPKPPAEKSFLAYLAGSRRLITGPSKSLAEPPHAAHLCVFRVIMQRGIINRVVQIVTRRDSANSNANS